MGQFKARQSFLGTNRSSGRGRSLNRRVLKIHTERREIWNATRAACGFGRINARGQLRGNARWKKTIILLNRTTFLCIGISNLRQDSLNASLRAVVMSGRWLVEFRSYDQRFVYSFICLIFFYVNSFREIAITHWKENLSYFVVRLFNL